MSIYSQMLKNGDGIKIDLDESEKYTILLRMHKNICDNKKKDYVFVLNDEKQASMKENRGRSTYKK